MIRKEIEPCVRLKDSSKPLLSKAGEKNIPEHSSPDHDELYSGGYNNQVVWMHISTSLADGLYITEKILNQWEEGLDASLRMPTVSSEFQSVRIVGFNSPIKDEHRPGFRLTKVFFELDEELFVGDWQASNDEFEKNIQPRVNSLVLNDIVEKKVDEYGDLLGAEMMDKEVARECAEEYGRYSLTKAMVNGVEIRDFDDWEANRFQEMEWSLIMENVEIGNWSLLADKLVLDAGVETHDDEDSQRRGEVLRIIASLI